MEYNQLIEEIKKLTPVIESVGIGDCIEIDFNPEFVRRHLRQLKIEVTVRQLDLHTFRIWRR